MTLRAHGNIIRALQATLLLLFAALLGGCGASETLLSRSGPRPGWVAGTPQDTEEELRFRGLALGRNVLDERTMHDRAMAHARRQVAERIETRVQARTREALQVTGSAARGRDEVTRAEFTSLLETAVQEKVRLAAERDRYHERWRVDPGPFSGAFERHKYYVLVGYPREEYRRQVTRFVRLERERARARELLAQDRPSAAAELLEALLNDYPGASVPLRLQLAEAYRAAGRLGRAERVLEQALAAPTTDFEERRLRESLERIHQTFPEVPVRTVQVVYDTAGDLPPAAARTVVPQVLTAAGFRVGGLLLREMDRLRPQDVRVLARGAEWVVAVRIEHPPTHPDRRYYNQQLYPAAARSTVRIYALDGSLLAAGVRREDALRTQPREAVLHAVEQSLHAALRDALIAAAAQRE
jgi:tetratricopeptide (TPR) repeat protein